MIIACDIDGTLDADPSGFGSLLAGMKANGHRIVVLTGCSSKHVTQADLDEKGAYLTKLGMGNSWDELVVFADPPHEAKAQWVRENMGPGDLAFENSITNAQLMAQFTTVCLVWGSKCD